jgi:hypothetical protein
MATLDPAATDGSKVISSQNTAVNSIILHNMLIAFGEEEKEDWIDYDDFSDLDEAERAPFQEHDELNTAVPDWAPSDTRRTRLLNYFREYYFL